MKNFFSDLYPLWLFIAGFLGGTQFSLNNYPFLLVGSFAFFYLGLLSSQKSLFQSLIYAFSFGYGFFSYSHSWISQPLTAFGNLYLSIQPLVFVIVPAILAGYFVIIGMLNYALKFQAMGRVFALSLTTVLMEYLRCEYAPAVPLGQVGTVWLPITSFAQGAAIFGVYGLSFVTLLLSYSIGALKLSFRPFIISALICTSLFGWGRWRASNTNLAINEHIVRIVPTAWNQLDKYQSLENRIEHLKLLIDSSSGAFSNVPVLILWPETTIEFSLLKHALGYDFIYPEIKIFLQKMLKKNSMLLAGIVLRSSKNKAYNVLFGLTAADELSYVYKKRFLAPFGEFMPPVLRTIANMFGIHALDDFMRGSDNQPLLVISQGLKIKPIICYEGSFTQQVLQPYQTADLFVISTNDAWFRYNGKEQQFISHAFRAIEEGVPIIRCANIGFSGYVSPIGTYKVTLSDNPMNLRFHKPLPETPYRWITNYCPYWIELFLILCVLIIFYLELIARRKSKINLSK
ncbi:MAG: apolipoprotein N-acyltransferase [Candidatus Paracaedibacteraceae bacterium]|nr:apolipoprotein N-acyltransferase [Candidatus Paracaedibacteraceae bacterium]